MRIVLAVFFGLVLAVQVSAQLSYERLRQADRDPGSWLTYHGTYDGKRFSALDEISRANVQQLRPVWMYQVQGRHQTGGSEDAVAMSLDDGGVDAARMPEVVGIDDEPTPDGDVRAFHSSGSPDRRPGGTRCGG